MLGRDWIETVVPEPERAGLRTVVQTALALGRLTGHREDGVLTSLGVERRMSWTSVLQRDADGNVTAIAGIAHDVTDVRRAEAERATLVAAIEQSAESIIITDRDAWITYVNHAFERISGYPSREAIGRNPRFLKSGTQSATFFDAMWAALTNGLPWVADMTNRRKDGSLYHLTSVLSPIRAEDNSITGYVAVARDVSRERELETQAELLTRERALIAETLRSLPSGGSVEATAELFCRQVASLTDVVVTSLIIFEPDGSPSRWPTSRPTAGRPALSDPQSSRAGTFASVRRPGHGSRRGRLTTPTPMRRASGEPEPRPSPMPPLRTRDPSSVFSPSPRPRTTR